MDTNVLVVCAASLVGITGVAVQVALGGVVRCEDCFAEGTLEEGLLGDEAECVVVRPRGQLVRDGRVIACQVVRGEGFGCRIPARGGACNRILVLVRSIRNVESYLVDVVDV